MIFITKDNIYNYLTDHDINIIDKNIKNEKSKSIDKTEKIFKKEECDKILSYTK